MKKFLSIVAFLALAITAHAQLSFVCDGKEIASGATFATSKCDPKILEEDGAYAFFPDVSIKSTENANVTVNARSTKSFSFCMDGYCSLPGKNITKTTNLEANIPKELNIEPGGFYENTVTLKYDISAFITGKESTTKITMTLVVTKLHVPSASLLFLVLRLLNGMWLLPMALSHSQLSSQAYMFIPLAVARQGARL